MALLVNRNHNLTFGTGSKKYMKARQPDCCIYSEDGSQFKIHRELLCQTAFLRKILNDRKDCCCSEIEIFCPCSEKELGLLVKFLKTGNVVSDNVDDLNKTIYNLNEIFGFSNEILRLWPTKKKKSANNASSLSVKEEPFDPKKDIYTDQGENENDSDSNESEKDLQVEHSKCNNENLGNTMTEDIDFKAETDFEHGADEGKKDNVLDNGEKKKKPKKISGMKAKGSSIKKHPKQFNCNNCAASFILKSKLQRHINAVHLNLKPYECDHCQMSFAQKSDIQKHINAVHLKLKPFECDQCQKSFSLKGQLKNHINAIHLKIKPYESDQCKKSFSQKSQLITHVHQQIKSHKYKDLKTSSYKCSDCDSSFVTRNTLKHHVNRVHLKIKPLRKLVCNECEESFEHKQSLEYHMNRIHLKVKPYVCGFCKKAFHLEANLKRHLKRTHNDEANQSCHKPIHKK